MKNIREVVRELWLPLIILLIIVGVLFLLRGDMLKQGLISSFGGALVGVILGFVAEMVRDGVKELHRKRHDRNIYLKLIKEDAKSAHKSYWLYSRLLRDQNVPEEIKSSIPAPFDLRFWEHFSKDKGFLEFGTEEPFKSIFEIMWNLEKINEQIKGAKGGDKQAFQFAHAFYRLLIEEEETKKLLLKFMNESEIKKMEDKWFEKAKQRQ